MSWLITAGKLKPIMLTCTSSTDIDWQLSLMENNVLRVDLIIDVDLINPSTKSFSYFNDDA